MQLGRTLCFGNDGSKAAITSPEGIHVVDVSGALPPRFHAITRIVDVAPVGKELWAAASDPAVLFRFGIDRELNGQHALWGKRGLLRPTAIGGPGALWSEPEPAVLNASGATTKLALADDVDCAIPVSSTRWVTCRREHVELRDPGTKRWSGTIPVSGGRVVDGVTLFDGRTVALLVATSTAGRDALAQLLVLGLNDGSIQHRMTLSGIEAVRFAPTRGFALMRSSSQTLVLIDLRFGEILKERREDTAIVDVAIDPNGRMYMTRFGDAREDITIGTIR